MNNSNLAVIVPIYEVEQYIDDCLNSILHQTYREYELVLVDDGSPDHCPEYIDMLAFCDARVIAIHKKNKGLSDARNQGLNLEKINANCEWITFIDSDDGIVLNYFDLLLKEVEKNPVEIVVCRNSIVENIDLKQENSKAESRIYSGKEACLIQYKFKDIIPVMAWGKLYRKKLFENISFPVGKINEDDAAVPILLYKAKTVCKIEAELYLYRFRENSIMTSPYSIKRFDAIDALFNCKDYFAIKKEYEILNQIKINIQKEQAYHGLLARKSGLYADVPEKYKINLLSSFYILKKYCSKADFEFYLSIMFPAIERLIEYKNKLKKVIKESLFGREEFYSKRQ